MPFQRTPPFDRETIVRGVVVLTAVLLGLPSAVVAQQDLPSRIEAVRDAIVTIVTYDRDDNILASGSGFLIAPTGALVTNRHVMVGAFRAEALFPDGQGLPVETVIGTDDDADLALLEVGLRATSPPPTLQLTTTMPNVGESVFVVGAPLGLDASASTGIVAALRSVPPFGEMIQITAPISPGSSGSPVMNQEGKVIGIATMGFVGGQNLNFAVPAARLQSIPMTRTLSLASWGARTRRARRPAPAIIGLRGSRVRIAAPQLGSERLAGRAATVRGDTLVFKPDMLAAHLYIPASTIRSIEVSRGRKHLGPLVAIMGGVGLGYLGWELGWNNTLGIDCKPDPWGEPQCQLSPAERGVQGALLLGLLGAGTGWLLGSEISFERWQKWNLGGVR